MSARDWLRAAVQSWLPVPPAEQLQVGDTVFVWAHDTPHLATSCAHELWRYGTVTDLDTATAADVLRPLQITLDAAGGRMVVHAVTYAVAYVVAGPVIERPGPADDPQPTDPAALPLDRKRAIKVAAIRPGMDVTVEVSAEARTTSAGSSIAQVAQHTERGHVVSVARKGDLVLVHLWDGTDEDRGRGRRVYANARHGAVLHVDVDEPYDQTQEDDTL